MTYCMLCWVCSQQSFNLVSILTLVMLCCGFFAGRGLTRLGCHGALFPVFLLDHNEDQPEDQRERQLQVHRHPRYLRLWELWGERLIVVQSWVHLDVLKKNIWRASFSYWWPPKHVLPSCRWTGLNSLISTTPTRNSRSTSTSTSSRWNSWSTTGEDV